MRATAFVFARGGSKGLPGKNLRLVGGIPLVTRAIHTALQCSKIDRVFLSTDDETIAATGRNAGAIVPELRPQELATDDVPEMLAWEHALTWCQVDGECDFDCFVSVPPTAPLRTVEDLSRAIEMYEMGDCDAVVTGSEARRHPDFNLVTADQQGFVARLNSSGTAATRRQDVSLAYDLTTVAYVTSPGIILQGKALLDLRCRLCQVPRERAIDIDDEFDLFVANCLLEFHPERAGGKADGSE